MAEQTAESPMIQPVDSAQETAVESIVIHLLLENKASREEDKLKTVGVRNPTNKRLLLKFEVEENQSHSVKFAPLQKRLMMVSDAELAAYRELDTRGLILLEHKDQPEPASSSVDFSSIIGGLGFIYFLGGGFLNGFLSEYPWYNQLYYWIGVPVLGLLIFILIKLYNTISRRKGWTTVRLGAAQSLTLMLVMIVGLGLTTATIYFFGDGPALLQSGPSLTLLTRLLQLHFVGVATLLPALLYYLFDRQQLGTLRERFEHQIFKLDPTVESLGDVQAKYGSQLDELYGRDYTTSQGRLVRGTRWPILLCTLVLAAGWIMTLQPVGTGINIQTPGEILAFFSPRPTPLTFGFLGTYYFALNMILRRYTRGDLQPKAYSHVAARIFIVAISAWVVEMLFGANAYSNTLVFIIGIVPDTFITAIQEFFRNSRIVARVVPQLQEKHPLTGLEGIDLYDRSRLAEEGVTNVESLAHHDLIDLILSTRIPVPRLVDWVDQAILYLHLSEDSEEKSKTSQFPKMLHQLRMYGIRNASELEKILNQGGSKKEDFVNSLDEGDTDKELGRELGFVRIEAIYAAMQDDDWLDYIRHWRKSNAILTKTITIKPTMVASTA